MTSPDEDLDAETSQSLLLLLYTTLTYQTMVNSAASQTMTAYFQSLIRKHVSQFKSFQRYYTTQTSAGSSGDHTRSSQKWSNFDFLTDLFFVIVSEYLEADQQSKRSLWRCSTLFQSLQKSLRSICRCSVKMLTLSSEDGREDWDLESFQPTQLLEDFMTFLLTYALSWRRLIGVLPSSSTQHSHHNGDLTKVIPPVPPSPSQQIPFHIRSTFKYFKEVHETHRRIDVLLGTGVRALIGTQRSVLLREKIESMPLVDLEMMICESIGIHLPVWCEVSRVSDSESWIDVDKSRQDDDTDLPLLHDITWLTLLVPLEEDLGGQYSQTPTNGNRLDTKSIQRMKSSTAVSSSSSSADVVNPLQRQIKEIQHLHQLRQLAAYLQYLDERLQHKEEILTHLLTMYRELKNEKVFFEKQLEKYLEEIVVTVDMELSKSPVSSIPPREGNYREYLRIYLTIPHRRSTSRSGISGSRRTRTLVEDLLASHRERGEEIKSQLKGFEKQMLEEFRIKISTTQETVNIPSLFIYSSFVLTTSPQILQQVNLIRQTQAKGEEQKKDGSLIPREFEECVDEIDRMEGRLVKANEDALLVIEKIHRMLKEEQGLDSTNRLESRVAERGVK
jgi:hypothetical protein